MEKEAIEALLENWGKNQKDEGELKRIYQVITGDPVEDCPKCINKALEKVRKYYHLTFVEGQEQPKVETPARKYLLKPGNHGFAPNGPANHNNDNTTDEEIEWYLEHYPHISQLLVEQNPE